MGRVPVGPRGIEPGATASGGISHIPLTGRLAPNGLALVDVILAHPDTGLFERQLDLEALRRQDLPDGSERCPGLIDTGATI